MNTPSNNRIISRAMLAPLTKKSLACARRRLTEKRKAHREVVAIAESLLLEIKQRELRLIELKRELGCA